MRQLYFLLIFALLLSNFPLAAQQGVSVKGINLIVPVGDQIAVKGSNDNIISNATGNIHIAGTLTVSGNYTNDGTLNIQETGVTSISENLTNQNTGQLSVDGTLNLQGNFTNNAVATLGNGDATYGNFIFNGSFLQQISGSSISVFENITVNNAAGIDLQSSIDISQSLIFTSGIISTNANYLSISNTSTGVVSGYNTTNYINGKVRRYVSAGNTYEIYTGTATNSNFIEIELISETGLSYFDCSFTEDATQTPPGGLSVNNTNITQFLDYGYWTVTADGGTFNYNISVESNGHTDLGGTADQYSLITDIGSGWQDIGTHSLATQTYTPTTITAKRSGLTSSGNFIIGFSDDALYDQPTLTNEIQVKGALLKIANGGTAYQIGSDGLVNITGGGGLEIDGAISLEGDWQNDGTASLTYGDDTHLGLVTFKGSAAQSISGTTTTDFERIEINNAAGISLSRNIQVTDELILTDGIISTGANNVYITTTGTSAISSYSENSYINGYLRQAVAATGIYYLPVGSATEYELATLNLTSNTGITYIQAYFTEDGTQAPPGFLTVNGALVDEFLDYGYWTLAPDAGYGEYDLTVRSGGHTNGTGTPDQYAVLSRISTNWTDYGVHSNTTQSFDGDYIIAKRSSLTSFGDYIVGRTIGDTYTQPTLTNEFRNKGTYLKLTGSDTVSIIGNRSYLRNENSATTEIAANATLTTESDFTLNSSSTISIDGLVNISGHLTNNGIADFSFGDDTNIGTIQLNGSSLQEINGSITTQTENLIINNSSNVELATDLEVNSTLDLNNGLIITNANKIVLRSTASIGNRSSSSYIAGNLRYYVNTGTYELPIGSTNYYEPGTLVITDATGLSYFDAFFTEDNSQTPAADLAVNGATITEFLNAGYWTINPDNAGSSEYNITFSSNGHTNGGGIPELYSLLTDRGSGWEDYGLHYNSTQSISGGTITAKRSVLNDFGSYIIGKANESTYDQPLITNELRNEGVYLNVNNTTELNVLGSDAAFNNDSSGISKIYSASSVNVNGDVIIDNDAQLRIDGTLYIAGDFTNNAKDSLVLSDDSNYGTVHFTGVVQQTIGGSSATIFDNITFNNTSSGLLLNQDMISRNEVSFSDGVIKTQGNKLIMQDASRVSNYNDESFINGTLRRYISTGTFTLPLGTDNLSEPAQINFTDATGVTYIDATFTEDNSQIVPLGLSVSGSAIAEFLNQGYWTITPDNAGTPSYDITIQSFGHTNGGALADQYAVISDIGSGWQDYGIHSSSTQIISGDSVLAKRSNLNEFGSYIIGKSEDDTYDQPLITNELRNEGVILKTGTAQISILGTDAAFNNDSTATTNIAATGSLIIEGDLSNNESSTIEVNGSISLTGNWTNNATGNLSDGDGTDYGSVVFNGTEQQDISGSSTTLFENFTINNSNNILLNSNIQVDRVLTFTQGKINTQTNKSIFTLNTSLSGYNANKYIIGNIRQYIDNGTFDLPVGTDQFIEPATIEFTDATGVSYIDVSFTKDHTQIAPIGLTVNGAAITELLDQGYWTITPDAVGSSVYNITVQSVGHTNGGASADQYAIVTDVGSGWQDLGTHSSSTQIVDADTVLAKRSDLTVYGNYMIGKSEDDTYQQPLITDELRNEGVYLKLGSNSSIAILGDDASFTNDSTATTSIDENSTFAAEGDINNNESSTISINGELSLTGNWTNNAVADLIMGDAAAYGSVLFNGTEQQNISGSSTTNFEDFVVNNSEGIYLENDIQIANNLTLTNGLIATVSNRVITESGATISNYSENSYISGNLRRYVSTGNYPLPVGNNTYFEYAQIDITNATGLTYIDASFNKDNTQIPPSGLTVNGAAVTEFLNYGYWTITPDNAGSSQYNITVQSFGHTNGGGTADQYSVITNRGSGWEDLGNHSPATQQINGDSIIAKRSVLNDYGNYIIGKTYEDTYIQPLITKSLQNDGVYIKTAATGQLNVVGTDAELINDDSGVFTIENTGSSSVEGNVVNDNSSNLSIDGTLSLTGDFTNNALADISDGDGTNDGTLVFNGTETQTINGTTSTQFENLTINNTQNVIIESDQEITKVLNFTNGLLETGVNTLIVSNTIKDAITGYDENKYIYGKLRRYSFIGDTIFFPIGTESYFEEAYVNLNSQTGLTYFDMSFTKDNTQTPPVGLTVSSAIINEFLNYGYWTLTANGGMSAIDYDITVISSGHTNGVVTGDSLALIADIGSGWQDIGTHSSSTQSINGIYTKAKRSNVTQTGSFIIGASNSPTYDQPTITDEIRVKEGYMKVASGELILDGPYAALNSGNQGIFVVSSSASTQINGDVNLSGSGSIQLDGTLTLTKDWTNDATSSLVYGDGTNKGTVEFAGTLEQTIDGTSQTYFENLEVNNSNNILLSSIDARIDEQLVFTNGLVSTGTQKVIVNNTGNIISGFDANSYIDGNLRQYVTTSSYDLPVGTADEYELAQITIATATDLGYIDVSYTQSDENPVPGGLTVNGTAMTDFLDYGYWTIAGEPGYSNLSYILTLNQRGHSDLGGPAERYAVVSQIPAGSGWDDYGNHSPSTQTYNGSVVSAKRSGLTAFGDYIIARGLTDLYLQPTITDEIRNIDTYLKINGSLPLIASGTNVELNNSSNGKFVVNASSLATINGNINNLGTSTISLDGTLELTGDWTNDATADLTLTGGDAGTVKFSGTDYQTIDGTTTTSFENLLVNNSDSIVLANNNHTITNELQFSSGLLVTGAQTLIISNTATNAITGYNSTSYVKGTLRKYVTTGSYDLPIGTTDYSQLANLNIASATDLDYIDISFTRSNENPVPGGLTVNSQPITNFTDYGYWTIVGEPGYSNLNYTFTGTIRGHTDLGPTSERYAILSQIPSTGAWSDNGNHSTSTQTYNTSFVTAARSGLSGFGDYIIGKGATSLYFQPPITEELRIKEAIVKISGGQNVSVQGSNVELNNASNSQLTIAASGTLEVDGAFNNLASATVSADGDISLTGDWTNNGNASTTLGDNTNYGTVTFNGTTQQTVGGSTQTTFENLTIDNTNDLLISGVDAEISNILTLTNGLIETGAQKVIVSNSDASAIADYDDTKYINGTLRRYLNTGSYDLPVGTADYSELANINIASSTGLNYVDAKFIVSNENPVPGGLTVNGQPITNFADYGYWNIEGESGYTTVNYILTATIKGHTDLGATSERYAIISQIPNSASWADNGTHSPSTQIYNASYVTAKRTALTGFGDFIIAKGSTALYNQPAITEELRIKNAIVRVNGSLPLNIQGTNAILNGESGTLNVLSSSETIVDGEIALDATSTIALDGTLSVTDDITNNGTADFSLGDATHKGNLIFNGTTDQSILGSTASVFENMTIDNGNSVILGATDISISEELIFTDGIITTNANMVVVTNNATSAISGYGINNFINGNLRRYVTTNTYDLPVGTSTTYELANIEIAAATDLNYIDVKYIESDENPVPGGLTVNGNIINNFLNYGYWNIEGEAGYSNLTYTITLSNRGHTDLGGNAEQYAVLSQIPNSAAWADNGVHSVSSQTYSASVVTAKRSYLSAFGDFIIGKGSTALYLQPLITDELMVIGANLKVTGSELNISGPSAELNNTETSSIKVNSGASINLYGDFNNLSSSTIGLDGNFNIDGTFTNNATASTILGDATNKGTVTFNGNTAQTVAGSSTTIFENLIIDNSADLNLAVNTQIEETLTFTDGSLITGAQQVIINNVATNAISGYNTDNYIVGNLRRYVNTNSFKLPIGTTDYLQLAEISINSATGLSYLDVSYVESTESAPANLQVNGNYIVKFLDHGYWTITANAGVTVVDYDITAHNFGHTNASALAINHSLISDLGNGWADNGTHNNLTQQIDNDTVMATRTNINTANSDFFGNYIIGVFGDPFNIPVTEELNNIAGIFSIRNNGTLTINGTSATINNQDIGTFNIASGSTLDLNGSFVNESASTLNIEGNLNVYKDFTNNATTNLSTGTISFVGTTDQTIGGVFTTDFGTLTINKPTGDILLNNDIEVSGTINLTSNDIILNNYDLTFADGVTINAPGNNSSYIQVNGSGRVVQSFASAPSANITIPIGDDADNYSPISFRLNSATLGASPSVSFGVTATAHPNLEATDAYIKRYWSFDETDIADPNYNVSIQYVDGDIVGDENTLIFGKYSGAAWSYSSVPATIATNTITWNNVTSFSDGTGLKNPTPLPVELFRFTADYLPETRNVAIKWITLSESENDYFTLEKSRDGSLFMPLIQINGAGNSSIMLEYNVEDEYPFAPITYYRLKQTDFDGSSEYSHITSATIEDDIKAQVQLYPNPARVNEPIQIMIGGLLAYSKVMVEIYNDGGQFILDHVQYVPETGKTTIEINTNNRLHSGTYIVLIKTKFETFKKQIVIK